MIRYRRPQGRRWRRSSNLSVPWISMSWRWVCLVGLVAIYALSLPALLEAGNLGLAPQESVGPEADGGQSAARGKVPGESVG